MSVFVEKYRSKRLSSHARIHTYTYMATRACQRLQQDPADADVHDHEHVPAHERTRSERVDTVSFIIRLGLVHFSPGARAFQPGGSRI